jgi:hypothetical protein
MSTCSIEFNKKLNKEITYLESLLDQGITVTSNGIKVKHYLDKLKSAKSVSANASASLSEIVKQENNILYTALRRELTNSFKAGFGSVKDKEYTLEDVKINKNGTYSIKVRPTVDSLVSDKGYWFTFKRGTDTSVPVTGRTSLSIPNISIAYEKALKTKSNVVSTINPEEQKYLGNRELARIKESLRLGSGKKGEFNKVIRRSEYQHGDIDTMLRLAEELEELDKGAAPEWYIDHARSLLGNMHQHFFRDMDLYIQEQSGEAFGEVDLGKNKISLSMSKDKTKTKSNLEVYLEEIIHSMTAWGLRSDSLKASQIKRELNFAFKKMLSSVTWQDYLTKPLADSSQTEIMAAKDTFEYIFNSTNSNDEFLAHVLTHPRTMQLAKSVRIKQSANEDRTILDKVTTIFKNLMDIVQGNFTFKKEDTTVAKQVNALAFRLAEINAKAEEAKTSLNTWGRINQFIDNTEQKFANWAEDFQNKAFKPEDIIEPPTTSSFTSDIWFGAKVLSKSFVNPAYRNMVGLTLSSWAKAGIPVKAGGTIRELVSSFFQTPDYARLAEYGSLEQEHIDTIRNTVISQTYESLAGSFNAVPNERMGNAITRSIVDTNASSLLYNHYGSGYKRTYTQAQLREVLVDDKIRNLRRAKAVKKLKTLLKDENQKDRTNWVINQAKGLGYYMATHKGNPAQNLSSYNIARGLLSENRYKPNKDIIALVEEIASLTAIQYTDKKNNEIAAMLLKDEWKGMAVLMDTYEDFKRQSKTKLFKDDVSHLIEGYSKEIFDDTLDIRHALMEDRKELEKEGYEFKGLVEPKGGEIRNKDVGIFISSNFSRAERFRGAVSLGSLSSRGTSLKEIKHLENPDLAKSAFERDMSALNLTALKISKMYNKENLDFEKIVTGVSPITNVTGKIIDYRYMMDKKAKENLLSQDTNALNIISRSMGSIIDKERREKANEKVLENIKKTMKEYWSGGEVGKDLIQFNLIGPDVYDPEMVELYNMLPKSFQSYINSRKDKVIAVPSELMPITFGYSHMMFTEKLKKVLPKIITRIVNMFESYFIDLVKILKGNVLLKMPLILITNIVSNALYLLNTTGMSPVELLEMHKESFRAAKSYLNAFRESNKLAIEIGQLESRLNSRNEDISSLKVTLKKKKDLFNRLKKEMKESSIHELFENGMFQTVIEDVNTGVLGESNKITNALDKVMVKTPAFIKTPLQVAYLSKETKWYAFNQEVLQLSDLVARDIKNKKMKHTEKQLANGKLVFSKEIAEELGFSSTDPQVLTGETLEKFKKISEKERKQELLDTFINYNKPNGRFEEYLNRLGLLMFSKYVKRIQRVVATTSLKHPIRSSTTLLAATLAIDLDNIQDQMWLVKGFDPSGDFSLGNIVTGSNPLDTLIEVITPALVKKETYAGLI